MKTSILPRHSVVTRLGLLLALSSLAVFPLKAQSGPQPVPVGKGSYAEYPPNPDAKLQEFLKANLHVNPSVKGRPLPSNDWWTDLLHAGFGGNLWAYPLVVRAVDRGVEIYYPTTWDKNGHDMEKGTPLTVSGIVKPVTQNTSMLIADFEDEKFPSGWTTSGTAFGDGPSAGAVPGESHVTGYAGNRLANSHHGGDNSTGTLTSPTFTIDKPYLHFMMAGGRQPDALYVSLEIDGKTVRKETGENSEQLKWRTWDLSEFAGKQGTIVIVDKATGGWGHVLCDQIIASSEPTPPRIGAANAFTPTDAVAADWGDWTLKMRLKQDDARMMDVTFGRGLPYTWFELTGIDPQLETAPDAAVLNDQGQPLTLPATAGHIIIKQDDRLFAAFAPEGTTWKSDGGKIVAQGAAGPVPYLVIAALPDISQIGLFAQHAFAIPRQSRFDWTYDPTQGRVATTWKLEMQALQGTDLDTIQGWLPHQYRETIQNLTFVAPEYATPRGKLRCTVGHDFAITWPFAGLPPLPPAPKVIAGVAHPFQPDRMKSYFADYIADKMSKPDTKRYGGDTYWGGKDLVQYALYAAMAHEMGDEADFKQLQDLSRNALIDWYTYTPGEQEHYFARYENWKAMVGFKTSYGSETFTDNHFHYGYFTLATALTGLNDPQFLQDYGPMATLVAKQYANWDRSDTRFPYLRTFEPWVGHSYAGGSSSGNGNNQESSSEAMQSWTGLFLLGVALKDKDMTAAGAMGWAIEESSIREYWNDYHGWKDGPAQANFPQGYGHTIAGIVGDSGMGYATFFNGEPRFIYGIQWLPISTGLYYLGRDPAFNQYQFDSMMKDQQRVKPGFTLSSLGADWGDVTLGYRQFGDPDAVAAQFDDLWDANDEIARSKNIAGLTYYFTHADRQLGPVAWDCHTDLPSSLVFRKPGEDHYTVVAWTPGDAPVTCKVFQGDKQIGTVSVPGHTLAALPIPAPK